MLSQCWVINGNISLAAVSHQPVMPKCTMGVVLISGFSQPMCDTDYFMSRLARKLVREGLYVLQVDPRGHGDSPGYLEEVTLETLREDIKSSIYYAREQAGGGIIGVGRGLTATLMAELASNLPIDGVAGINPYCVDPLALKKLVKYIDPAVIDTADILNGRDFTDFSDFDSDWMAFFEALGSGSLYNLIGQKISKKIIQELARLEPYEILQLSPETRFWLTANKNGNLGMSRWVPDKGSLTPQFDWSLPAYLENPFPRDSLWYHYAIEMICEWIVQKRGECNANTGANRC